MDGEVVGFLNFDPGKLYSTKHQGTFGISVKHSACRKGIGKKLLAAMIDECNHKGDIDIIRLNVLASNTTVIRFYESFGFQKEACFIDYVRKNGKSEDMLRMTLDLTSRKTRI
ncbi:Acetyltransferase (GNAT) family protein [Halobacillus dabanensis]|uniref:Acetyltransferase (GNAT) family protein n=1 Tax=Halobacillus dabanensis TaxID=240302 RepID=A0A1I3XKL0_HALDA|nr:N-acetyltransferase [Halobacillus dabanensis]SFK20147.1 Acetyltransferase (GNAT) family protein [Halobacillus dabanensis]